MSSKLRVTSGISGTALAGAALLALLGVSSAAAETPPTMEWLNRYSGIGNGNNQVTAMTIDSQGCVYVTGYGNGTGWDFVTIKYSPGGRQLAVARFNGVANMDDVPYALTLDKRGNVIVVGYTDGDEQSLADLAVVKYDSTLVQQWVRTYAGQFNLGLDEADAVAADTSGNVMVGGFSFEAPTNDDYVTLKYDPSGNLLWVQRYNGPGNLDDGVKSLALDSDANVYVTGVSQRLPGEATTMPPRSSTTRRATSSGLRSTTGRPTPTTAASPWLSTRRETSTSAVTAPGSGRSLTC